MLKYLHLRIERDECELPHVQARRGDRADEAERLHRSGQPSLQADDLRDGLARIQAGISSNPELISSKQVVPSCQHGARHGKGPHSLPGHAGLNRLVCKP